MTKHILYKSEQTGLKLQYAVLAAQLLYALSRIQSFSILSERKNRPISAC